MTRAFHDDPALRADLLGRIRRHVDDGTLLPGATRWDGTRGSALGVSVHGEDSNDYAARFGFPIALASLLDPIVAAVPADGPATAIAWVEAVEAGDDLSAVPMQVLEDLLIRLDARRMAPTWFDRLSAMHRQEAAGLTQGRAGWSAIRAEVEAAATDHGDGPARPALDACAAACWSLSTSRSVLVTLLDRWLRQSPPDSDLFPAADRARAHAVLEGLWQETAGRRDAGDAVDLPALFRARQPELAARFEADLDRANAAMGERAAAARDLVLGHLAAATRLSPVVAV